MTGTDNIEAASLIVTQDGLRDNVNVDGMIELVEGGHIFDVAALTDYGWLLMNGRVSPVIQLSRFEDGLIYIHDGHHRCTAIVRAGRKYLYPSEYELTDWTYKDYYDPAHHNNWYLPFDPRFEVRHPQLSEIKAHVRGMIKAGMSTEQIHNFVLLNSSSYKTARGCLYYVS